MIKKTCEYIFLLMVILIAVLPLFLYKYDGFKLYANIHTLNKTDSEDKKYCYDLAEQYYKEKKYDDAKLYYILARPYKYLESMYKIVNMFELENNRSYALVFYHSLVIENKYEPALNNKELLYDYIATHGYFNELCNYVTDHEELLKKLIGRCKYLTYNNTNSMLYDMIKFNIVVEKYKEKTELTPEFTENYNMFIEKYNRVMKEYSYKI